MKISKAQGGSLVFKSTKIKQHDGRWERVMNHNEPPRTTMNHHSVSASIILNHPESQ